MNALKKNLTAFFKNAWPYLLVALVLAVFFYPIWLKGRAPIPGDFIVGTYRPWLDYKWGYKVGVPVKNPITSDVVSVIYPLRSSAVDILTKGEAPLWLNSMFAGYPLLANFQAAILSPTMIFYFIFSKIDAWTLQVVWQLILSSLFMYLFLRNLKLEKISSVFGAIAYSLAAFNIVWLEWNAQTLTAAWIPLILFSLVKYINTEKIKYGVLLSVAVCLQLFSGYPQIAFYTWALAFLYFIVFIKDFNFKKICFVSFFFLMGFLLSSIQMLPGLELFKYSQRVGEFIDRNLRYLPWQNLITLMAPDYFGNPATGNYWGVGNYTLNTGYVGLISLVLAVIGAFKFIKKRIIKFLILLIVVVLISVLENPISKFIYENPAMGFSASSPTRMLILFNFAIATLSAFGISALIRFKDKRYYRFFYFPLIVVGGALLGTIISWKIVPLDNPINAQLKTSIRNMVIPFALTWFLGVVFIAMNRITPRVKMWIIFGIFLLSTCELLRFAWKFTPFSDKNMVFPPTPITQFFSEDKTTSPYRVFTGDVIPMNMWVPYGIESLSGYDAVFPLRWSRFVNVLKTNNPEANPGTRYADFDLIESKMFDLLNVRYLIAQKYNQIAVPSEDGQVYYRYRLDKFKKRFEDKTVAIMENTDSLERAFMAYDWEVLPENKILEKIINNHLDFSKKLYLEEEVTISKHKTGHSSLVWEKSSANERNIKITTDKDGLLFLSEMYYPGWKAYLDGKEIKIYRANYTFRAVEIPAGEHKLQFIYVPKSFTIGKWISLSTLFILVGLILYEQYTKRGTRAS